MYSPANDFGRSLCAFFDWRRGAPVVGDVHFALHPSGNSFGHLSHANDGKER